MKAGRHDSCQNVDEKQVNVNSLTLAQRTLYKFKEDKKQIKMPRLKKIKVF
jgi:hypothetical protein